LKKEGVNRKYLKYREIFQINSFPYNEQENKNGKTKKTIFAEFERGLDPALAK